MTMTLLWLVLAPLVSEDLTCIAAGLLVARGELPFWPAAGATFAGIFLGDIILYVVGRRWGRAALRKPPLRWWIKEADWQRASDSLRERGSWLVFIARFVPSLRLTIFTAAGILHFPARRFLGLQFIAGLIWTPILVGLSASIGERMKLLVHDYEKASLLVAGVVIVAVLGTTHVLIPLCTWRGRRLLQSRWRRLTHWEYWPAWALYAPVSVYIAWLALKHRSLTVFTCANPAIPGGGFLGESKVQILSGLAGAKESVARWTLLSADQAAAFREQQLAIWMKVENLSWPVVLKPDVGERGQGVGICRNLEQAARYLAANSAAVIAQEYIPGGEYGVFYYRHPDELAGHIFAITDKRFPSVTGDGRQTLEQLILNDARAIGSARFFLEHHAARLAEIPRAGETVPLTELGTHCRGSLFLDGTENLLTPELTAAVDALSKHFEGYYFGRYDIRCPTPEDLRAGRNLRVIELNGVTSEATSMYDPKHSVLFAWATLCRQWRLCFAIGAANRARGARPESLANLLRAWGRSLREEKFEAPRPGAISA